MNYWDSFCIFFYSKTLTQNKTGLLDVLLTKDMFEDYDHEIDTTYGINLSILSSIYFIFNLRHS